MARDVRLVPIVEILAADGRTLLPERRAWAGPFRPYPPPQRLGRKGEERRRRPRPPVELRRGERIDRLI